MVYKMLSFQRHEDFEAAATELINHGFEPIDKISINTVIVRHNPVTQQAEMAQMIMQGFIGDEPLPNSSHDRASSPLITA